MIKPVYKSRHRERSARMREIRIRSPVATDLGRDSSIAKRSVKGVSVMGPQI